MKIYSKILLLILLLFRFSVSAQIIGKITDTEGNPLTAANIYIENSTSGTTSNHQGNYKLIVEKTGNYQIAFQYLGFKTQVQKIKVDTLPFTLNVRMEEESSSLNEVVIGEGENPAYRIIKKAITHRKENLKQLKAFTADFYSRGTWTISKAPERILGAKVTYGDNIILDSTRSGILYLSETKSKIKFWSPNNFHEHIIASKVSGNDNGFSWNSAREANFSFYENTIMLNRNMISPIADYAFDYYDFKLADAFYNEQGQLINKIEVIPKHPNNPVFSGFIYIVEDLWQIYGIALKTTGEATQIPPVKTMRLKQSFVFSKKENRWVKFSQDIRFTWKFLKISGEGKFIAVYSNYDFSPHFSGDEFGKEILDFAHKANKKDTVFWNDVRPVPLTATELKDYTQKDRISKLHKSKAYKDSIDREANRFSPADIIFGYSKHNSYKKYKWGFSSPLLGTHFNTVQGWNIDMQLYFQKEQDKYKKYWQFFSDMNYGFSDHRYRISGGWQKKFNDQSKALLTLEGGVKAEEINNTDPLPYRINDIANILFERNYLKLYQNTYAKVSYSEEWFNGFRFYSSLSFNKRKPLLNTTNHVFIENKHGGYTSNNPLAPKDFNSVPFQPNRIFKLNLTGRIRFDQKYYSYPDQKVLAPNPNYPTLYLTYETGFASDISNYNYHKIQAMVTQNVDLSNKGTLGYSLKAGTFIHGDKMAFTDYKHFKGNQTRIATSDSYLNVFNLMPYYDFSTNQSFFEVHLEHNFKGWVLGRIPGLNQLNYNLVVGAHALWTGDNKPYREYTLGLDNLGFGNFRFMRIDYARSYYNGQHFGAVIFGLKFLGVLD